MSTTQAVKGPKADSAAEALARFEQGAEFEPWRSAVDRMDDPAGAGIILFYSDGSQLFVPDDGEAEVWSA